MTAWDLFAAIIGALLWRVLAPLFPVWEEAKKELGPLWRKAKGR